jgi:LPPG:FO 2-phospho-L-lactate transferase
MKITALAGGVGGAKFAHGLNQLGDAIDLTVIANTGDDFEHLGLHISPDIDTLCYTLAERVNPETGWGRNDESWHVLEEISSLGGPDWFRIGDRDFATHIERTRRMANGESLSQVTTRFCEQWGVNAKILPMSDSPVQTMVKTVQGWMGFQEYFVKNQFVPKVEAFEFKGISEAMPSSAVMQAINDCDLIIICPSNPWVSIDPILAIPGLRAALLKKPVIAISPLIGGKVVKGPAAKMFAELGISPSALAVADHYKDLLSLIVIDHIDQDQILAIEGLGIIASTSDILMKDNQDRRRLAMEVIDFAKQLVLNNKSEIGKINKP